MLKGDIVVPHDNEEDLVVRAQEIGYDFLLLLYSKDKRPNTLVLQKLKDKYKIKLHIGIIVRIEKSNQIRSLPGNKIVLARSTGTERSNDLILSSRLVDLTTDLSPAVGREHTHYRRTGVTQVHAKQAKESEIAYVVDFARLLALDGGKRLSLFGRLAQNVRVFHKYKVPIVFASLATDIFGMRAPKDFLAMARTMGIEDTAVVGKTLHKTIKAKEDRAAGRIAAPGVRIKS